MPVSKFKGGGGGTVIQLKLFQPNNFKAFKVTDYAELYMVL